MITYMINDKLITVDFGVLKFGQTHMCIDHITMSLCSPVYPVQKAASVDI